MLLAASESAGHEEAQIALHDTALVFGQAVRVFPQLDVALYVHFLRYLGEP